MTRSLSLILSFFTVIAVMGDAHGLTLSQRQFLDAEKALEKGQQQRFARLAHQLKDYPLFPYLEYKQLLKRLSRANTEEVRDFLETYPDFPLTWRIRHRWLKRLKRERRWQTFLDFYQPTQNASLECQYRQVLLELGRTDQALRGIEHLWLVGYSQAKECDPIFFAWEDSGQLSDDLVWQRIKLTMDAGRPRLARYLRRYLSPSQHRWVDLWYRVHRRPTMVLEPTHFKEAHRSRNAILSHGIKRLVWRDADKALAAWERVKDEYVFSLDERADIQGYLAMALGKKRHPQALTWLMSVDPAKESQRVRQWRVRNALYKRDWTTVLAAIAWLSEEERNTPRWRYWRGRAMEALGFQGQAQAVFQKLARERNYHGFLAADRLEKPYRFEDAPQQVSEEALNALENQPAIARARELFELDRIIAARREWRHGTRTMDRAQLRNAAKLAQRWGWHSRAIFTAAQGQYWDDVALRFPIDHQGTVLRQAQRQAIEPAWVYGVMRQESAFMRDARSGAGALGLMQLMPRTGRHVARRLNTRLSHPYQLLKADRNIRFGTAYLREVRNRFYDHPVLATAAYNAGPVRVKRWLPTDEVIDADIWVETIPFHETRQYLERVLAYTVIYQWRLNDERLMLKDFMQPVASPSILTRNAGDTGHDAS